MYDPAVQHRKMMREIAGDFQTCFGRHLRTNIDEESYSLNLILENGQFYPQVVEMAEYKTGVRWIDNQRLLPSTIRGWSDALQIEVVVRLGEFQG